MLYTARSDDGALVRAVQGHGVGRYWWFSLGTRVGNHRSGDEELIGGEVVVVATQEVPAHEFDNAWRAGRDSLAAAFHSTAARESHRFFKRTLTERGESTVFWEFAGKTLVAELEIRGWYEKSWIWLGCRDVDAPDTSTVVLSILDYEVTPVEEIEAHEFRETWMQSSASLRDDP